PADVHRTDHLAIGTERDRMGADVGRDDLYLAVVPEKRRAVDCPNDLPAVVNRAGGGRAAGIHAQLADHAVLPDDGTWHPRGVIRPTHDDTVSIDVQRTTPAAIRVCWYRRVRTRSGREDPEFARDPIFPEERVIDGI